MRFLPFAFFCLSGILNAAELTWIPHYDDAYRQALTEKRPVLVYFQGEKDVFSTELLNGDRLQKLMSGFILTKMALDYVRPDKEAPFITLPVFKPLQGKSGLAIVRIKDQAGTITEFLPETKFSVTEIRKFLNPSGTAFYDQHLDFVDQWKDGSYASASSRALADGKLLVLLIDDHKTNRYEAEKLAYIKNSFPNDTVGFVAGEEGVTLLKDPRFYWMLSRPGIAVLDFRKDSSARLKYNVVRILPNDYINERNVKIFAGVPAGLTLTQSTMTFAVREHPEACSANGSPRADLMEIAEKNCLRECEMYQSIYRQQGYGQANYYGGGHYQQGHGYQTEVGGWSWSLAERPENRCMVKAAMNGVRVYEWIYRGQKHGHWGAVCQRWNYFGWDMQYVTLPDGRDSKWFITGDFSN